MSQSIFPGGSIYGPAVAAMLRGDTVYQSYGVQFEFASGPLAVWQGFGQLDAREFVDVAGHVSPLFDGIGNFGKVGSIEIGAGAQTQGVVLELSGIDARIALLAQNQGANRHLRVFIDDTRINCTIASIHYPQLLRENSNQSRTDHRATI